MQVVERHSFNSPACAPVERHVLQRSWKLLGAISAIMERGTWCERAKCKYLELELDNKAVAAGVLRAGVGARRHQVRLGRRETGGG
jgi:hypothetical protein